jgi:hypothetical protein
VQRENKNQTDHGSTALNTSKVDGEWKHPCDQARGRVFLGTASRNTLSDLSTLLSIIFIARLNSWALVFLSASSQARTISLPTHPLLLLPYTFATILHTRLHNFLSGRGGPLEGVHPPSPSSFAPRSSRLTVDSFCAPCRLPAGFFIHIYHANANIHKTSFQGCKSRPQSLNFNIHAKCSHHVE